MKSQLMITAALIAMICGSSAIAGEKTKSSLAKNMEKTNEEQKLSYINRYDANADLAVSKKERDFIDEMTFNFMDKNGDKTIHKNEYIDFRVARIKDKLFEESEAHTKQSIIRFNSLDNDQDEKITFAEFTASSNRIFNNFDKNSDGILNAADKKMLDQERKKAESENNLVDDRSDEAIKRIKRKMSSANNLLSMPSTHNWNGVFVQYDKERNGSISQKAFNDQRRALFDSTDTNNDGWLSDKEYIDEYKYRVAHRTKAVKKYFGKKIRKEFDQKDSDGNRRFSLEEYQKESLSIFGRLDADGDGFVSLDDEYEKSNAVASY